MKLNFLKTHFVLSFLMALIYCSSFSNTNLLWLGVTIGRYFLMIKRCLTPFSISLLLQNTKKTEEKSFCSNKQRSYSMIRNVRMIINSSVCLSSVRLVRPFVRKGISRLIFKIDLYLIASSILSIFFFRPLDI